MLRSANDNKKRRADKLTRRELTDGSSLAKQFYDPEGFRAGLPVGWSPALVLFLGAAASNYGGNVRSKLYKELREFDESSSKVAKLHQTEGPPDIICPTLFPNLDCMSDLKVDEC